MAGPKKHLPKLRDAALNSIGGGIGLVIIYLIIRQLHPKTADKLF